MKRRKFIEKSALSLPSLMLLSSLIACGKEEDVVPILTEKSVVIIGAGMAGLSAAKYLMDRNVKVILVEAQEKVGGRLRTDRSLGFAFDEGASWIHGPDGNPITALANSAGATTFLTDDDNVAVFDIDGTQYADKVLDDEEEVYDDILEKIDGSINESFQEVFYEAYPQYQNNRLWRYMLSSFLEFDTGGDIAELSSLDFEDDEAYKGDDLIITNGFDTVAEFLAEGIDIKLNSKVQSINYLNEVVEVVTDRETFEADFVMVTTPLGVLKKEIISFNPALPSTIKQAVDNLQMGSINKFVCVWDTPFWDTELQYIGYTAETKGKYNFFLNLGKFTNENALMTFAFGDYSIKTEGMTDGEIIDDIMIHLKSIYGQDIPNPTSILRTKWVTNEYTFGSYSFATNGSRSSDFKVFEEPVANKLFFAGEHTSKDYRGTVHGAYLSGIRAAKDIADLL